MGVESESRGDDPVLTPPSGGAVQIVLSLLLVGFAVYLSWDGPEPTEEPVWISTTELVFTILFTVDYFAHLFAAEDRWAFCISFFAVIDVVTILPVRPAPARPRCRGRIPDACA